MIGSSLSFSPYFGPCERKQRKILFLSRQYLLLDELDAELRANEVGSPHALDDLGHLVQAILRVHPESQHVLAALKRTQISALSTLSFCRQSSHLNGGVDDESQAEFGVADLAGLLYSDGMSGNEEMVRAESGTICR